jgi:ribose 5-phosphate isomerase B
MLRKKICIASDHAGFSLKEYLKFYFKQDIEWVDYGCFSSKSVDYPDFVHPLANDINEKKYQMGVVICGSGNGVSMVANKYLEVRAALCWNTEIAHLSRCHNNANVLALPARFMSEHDAF